MKNKRYYLLSISFLFSLLSAQEWILHEGGFSDKGVDLTANFVLQHINQSFYASHQSMLKTLTGYFSGQAPHEFKILKKLKENGYQIKHLNLIDIEYEKATPRMGAIAIEAQKIFPEITIHFFAKFSDYLKFCQSDPSLKGDIFFMANPQWGKKDANPPINLSDAQPHALIFLCMQHSGSTGKTIRLSLHDWDVATQLTTSRNSFFQILCALMSENTKDKIILLQELNRHHLEFSPELQKPLNDTPLFYAEALYQIKNMLREELKKRNIEETFFESNEIWKKFITNIAVDVLINSLEKVPLFSRNDILNGIKKPYREIQEKWNIFLTTRTLEIMINQRQIEKLCKQKK